MRQRFVLVRKRELRDRYPETRRSPPRRLVGGGSTEELDPNKAGGSDIDIARQFNLYDWLVYPGPTGVVQMHLAESMEPNSDATAWTVRLRHGVEFHNGKPLTADDLMYTLRYIDDAKHGEINLILNADGWTCRT